MRLIMAKDYEDLSKQAADYFIKKIQGSPAMTIGLATGSTPEGMYRYLVRDYKENRISFRNITTFNLDEYVGLDGNNKNSYQFFMNDHLFNHIDIEKSNAHIPGGISKDISADCATYEQLIKKHGGIDLQLLGIGGNGHIGFNEPGSSFQSRTRIVELTDKTRRDNARFFNSFEEVPTEAVTMGMGTILESKEILMLISGEGKREAARMLLSGNVNEDFPASALHKHPNAIVIADEAALADVPADLLKAYL
ncbi:glucosamine-6-phosphate deaminase [Schinkia azotoformans]|uniref:glucosamine-6-phosphate deaminase n=1 Tax=Schinkia azotoformans TaxID=1454 RepID=UPI002DC01B01|nr:glucosamine-6-phosphate deaminase [Schinkia azotoformans]MEC1722665.1 glucosamine-6-phosphate deaminase [Schinkia azotoformans]MED4415861.1 glucosamine-6-phosphate deaminase [Schinkia azotoformans]